MEKGFVKWFDTTRGFGFITNEDTKKDIFFHHTDALDKLASADYVQYEVEEGHRGSKAIEVKKIK